MSLEFVKHKCAQTLLLKPNLWSEKWKIAHYYSKAICLCKIVNGNFMICSAKSTVIYLLASPTPISTGFCFNCSQRFCFSREFAIETKREKLCAGSCLFHSASLRFPSLFSGTQLGGYLKSRNGLGVFLLTISRRVPRGPHDGDKRRWEKSLLPSPHLVKVGNPLNFDYFLINFYMPRLSKRCSRVALLMKPSGRCDWTPSDECFFGAALATFQIAFFWLMESERKGQIARWRLYSLLSNNSWNYVKLKPTKTNSKNIPTQKYTFERRLFINASIGAEESCPAW